MKRCNWMQEPDWNDCGEPATRVHETTTLCYCEKHVAAFRGTVRLQMIEPEKKSETAKKEDV